jgi:polyhydroxybutyrate depolymerase
MKKIMLSWIVFGVALNAEAQTTIIDSLLYTGVWHTYRVYVPASHTCSLIIHLHGYGSDGALEQIFTNYMPVADTAGFIVAYPDGLIDEMGNRYWNIGWSFLPNTNDVGYLSVLIDTLVKNYSINLNNVFASGLSMGGFMCHKLACELGNKVAAIADVSGSITTPEYMSCAPSRAVPVMEIHGTADATVPYTGSTDPASPSVDIDTVMKFSANIDGCNPVPVHTPLPHNVNTTDGSSVDHYVYTGGLQGATCELYKINGGGHIDWPGEGSGNNNDFNASQAIWNFFNNYHPVDCALPVTLTSFTGKRENEDIALTWLTQRELNNKYFEVQRSVDAVTFTIIGTVAGHGNVDITQQYTFTDRQPPAGINYYRLKQVDEDGRSVFSNIIKVSFAPGKLFYSLYPNPASGIIHITMPSSIVPSAVTVFDVQGKILLHIAINPYTTFIDIGISKFSPGVYQVNLQQGNQKQIWKMVKL